MKTRDFEDDDCKFAVIMFDLMVFMFILKTVKMTFHAFMFYLNFQTIIYVIKKVPKTFASWSVQSCMLNALEQYSRKNHITPDIQKQESTMFYLLV